MIFVFLGALLVYGVISFLVAAIIWMFTTIAGLVLLVLFVLMVIGNLMAPTPDDDEEDA